VTPFGSLPDGRPVECYTLAGNIEVTVLTLGATLNSVNVDGTNVTLGHDSVAGYLDHIGYRGATVGRCANRIANGRFTLDGVEHRLSVNEAPNTLHGGVDGFNRRLWSARVDGEDVVMELTSPDGDQGFPGTLHVEVRYAVSGSELRLDYRAVTDRATVVNLTSHAYWNLAGGGPIDDHELQVDASRYTPVDATLIPTGAVADVAGTSLDFTRPRPLGPEVYDENFVLDEGSARLFDPASGRTLELVTTQPGLQVFTGDRGGVALETQAFPDAPNQPAFPSTVLRPGEEYRQSTGYRFS
jgi:aldose 1-epimerase